MGKTLVDQEACFRVEGGYIFILLINLMCALMRFYYESDFSATNTWIWHETHKHLGKGPNFKWSKRYVMLWTCFSSKVSDFGENGLTNFLKDQNILNKWVDNDPKHIAKCLTKLKLPRNPSYRKHEWAEEKRDLNGTQDKKLNGTCEKTENLNKHTLQVPPGCSLLHYIFPYTPELQKLTDFL